MSRRRNSLVGLVASGSFSAGNWRHRKLLLEEDLPEGVDEELRVWQRVYRRRVRGVGGWAASEARGFEREARGG